jgi:hypothetical protein
MKKISILLIVLVTGASLSFGQSKCFEKGNVLLNPGIGFGERGFGRGWGWGGSGWGTGFRPTVSFSADFGVHDYVSVGPYVGMRFYGDGVNAFGFGARGSFHWWQLLDDKVAADLKQDQLELYYTLYLGGNVVTVRDWGSDGRFGWGSTLGLRWYPNANNRFALFGEFGASPITFTTIGCTIKVK